MKQIFVYRCACGISDCRALLLASKRAEKMDWSDKRAKYVLLGYMVSEFWL